MSSRAHAFLLPLAVAGVAVLMAAACGGGGDRSEPEEFSEFVDRIAAATEQGDVAFFTERVRGTPYTCSAAEVEISTGPDAPPAPICTEVGLTFDSVYIQDYPGATQTKLERNLTEDIQNYFADALGDREDQYGPGAVRLYATGISVQPPATGRAVHTAILTGIHDSIAGEGRTVRAVDFEYVDGQWLVRGETAGSFPTAVDLLEPSTAAPLYDGWTPYGG